MKINFAGRLIFLISLSPFVYLPASQCLAKIDIRNSVFLNRMETLKDSFAISGKVLKREEVWDRRTNPMMGRPDILIEIIFHIQIISVISGDAPKDSAIITVSVKDQKKLIKFKGITKDQSGIFTLQGSDMPYGLINFEASSGKADDVVVDKDSISSGAKDKIKVETDSIPKTDSLSILEKKSGKEMLGSKQLQEEAVNYIARQYGMKNAEFITYTSFSGPCPPDGGYVYWGVRGQVNDKWYVWQPGKNGKLREGTELDDPQKYQKCNSPNTKILTPSGPIPISSLKIGDTVLSSNNIKACILQITKVRAVNHRVCRTTFDDGTIIEISPGHPLANGKLFGALQIGDMVDGRRVLKNELIPYMYKYTWDILPDSPTGTYFIGGIEIASTIKI